MFEKFDISKNDIALVIIAFFQRKRKTGFLPHNPNMHISNHICFIVLEEQSSPAM